MEVAQWMDQSLEPSKTSIIVPACFKVGKTQNLIIVRQNIEPEQMENLQQFVHYKFRQAGNEIYRGNTEIKPYSLGNRRLVRIRSLKQFVNLTKQKRNRFNELKKQSGTRSI